MLIFHIQNVSDTLCCPFILWSINKHCTTPNGHVGVHGMTYISRRLKKLPATRSSASSATSSATWWSCMAMAMVWLLENKRDLSYWVWFNPLGFLWRTPIKSKASLQKQRSRFARRLPNCCQSIWQADCGLVKRPLETNSYIGVAPSTFTCPGDITGVQWCFYSVVFFLGRFPPKDVLLCGFPSRYWDGSNTRRKGSKCKIATTSHDIHFQILLLLWTACSTTSTAVSRVSLTWQDIRLHGDFKTHSRFQSSRKVYHPQISLQFLFKLLYIWERSQSQWSKTSTLRIDLDDCLASPASSCTTCTACSQQLQTITRQWAGKCAANAIFEPNTINSSKKRLCA